MIYSCFSNNRIKYLHARCFRRWQNTAMKRLLMKNKCVSLQKDGSVSILRMKNNMCQSAKGWSVSVQHKNIQILAIKMFKITNSRSP